MNILFDLNHPAHFHLFKNIIKILNKEGHSIYISARSKDILTSLLDKSNLTYFLLKKTSNRFLDHSKNLNTLIKVFKEKKIDIAIGVSVLIAQASKFSTTNSIVLDDDDIKTTRMFAFMSHSFANHVVSPVILQNERNRTKDLFHHSLHELAYLHPRCFNADRKTLEYYHLEKDEFYSILRLSALKAQHDIGEKGISYEQSLIILKELETKGKVFISSEKELPNELKKYAIIEPENFHHLLAFSKILVCDSQTVASEAAVLGIPSIRINTFVGRISYLEELENKFELTFGFRPHDFGNAIKKIQNLVNQKDCHLVFQKRRKKMLSEKIDLTAFIVWLIENYPQSTKIMKENPSYQYNFK